mgnify:CR=1 FL=1
MESKLATAADACRRLRISKSSLWRLRRSGLLTPVMVGRAIRYRVTDLEAIERSGTAAPVASAATAAGEVA